MLNEEKIIKNIQSDVDVESGFKQLVSAYKERIYWHIRGIVNVHEDAADIMQNTFIKAYKNIKGFKSDSKFYTWIYRIATNESLNHLKKNKKYRSEDLGTEMYKVEADSYFDGDEAQKTLSKALETLPPKQKLVFNMKYFDEMTYEQISKILDTSVGALKASFHHGKNKIEAFIKNEGI